MLVLTRKTSESIMIDDDIEIMVVAMQGDRVRLGISAPRNRKIHRKEIWLQPPTPAAETSAEPTAA